MHEEAVVLSPKKRSPAWFFASLLYVVSLCSFADGNTGLSLEGELKDNTCTFDAGSTVVLDPVVRREFSGKGSVLGVRSLSIALSSCGTEAGKVVITVSGNGTSEDEYAFANASTGSGSASGVGLYFYQDDGNTLFRPDGTVTQSITTLAPSANNTLPFRAGYVALQESPVAGAFTAVVNVSLEYR